MYTTFLHLSIHDWSFFMPRWKSACCHRGFGFRLSLGTCAELLWMLNCSPPKVHTTSYNWQPSTWGLIRRIILTIGFGVHSQNFNELYIYIEANRNIHSQNSVSLSCLAKLRCAVSILANATAKGRPSMCQLLQPTAVQLENRHSLFNGGPRRNELSSQPRDSKIVLFSSF